MSTSGSKNFTQTRNEIINDAYQLLGLYGIGRTISAEDSAFAVSQFNKMIKAWGTKGLHLWAKEEGVLYTTQYTSKYSIGNASTDAYATLKSDEIVTQLNGALATSTTSVTVDSTTGMTVGDYIGIVLTDKSSHWTTIATLPSSTTLTLTTGVTGAASDNNLVYTFTNRIYKPLRVLNARLVNGIDSGENSTISEVPLSMVSYQTYFELPAKITNGNPIQATYQPQLNNGLMYVWPRPSDTSYRVEFSYERVLDDVDNGTDNIDFPDEWLECATYQLAIRLGPAFGKTEKTMRTIVPLASIMLEDLLNWDSEVAGVSFSPDLGGC